MIKHCTDCGSRLRGSVWHPTYNNHRIGRGNFAPNTIALCADCITLYPDHDDLTQWMGFDIVHDGGMDPLALTVGMIAIAMAAVTLVLLLVGWL